MAAARADLDSAVAEMRLQRIETTIEAVRRAELIDVGRGIALGEDGRRQQRENR